MTLYSSQTPQLAIDPLNCEELIHASLLLRRYLSMVFYVVGQIYEAWFHGMKRMFHATPLASSFALLIFMQTNCVAQFGALLRPTTEERGRENEREDDEIETDRDSFTPSTNVMGRGRLGIESSYSFIDNRNVSETHSLPELLFRYGIGEKLEFRFGYNYEVGGASGTDSGNVPFSLENDTEIEEESKLLYGMKVRISKQENWMPSSSVIIQGHTPTSGNETASSFSSAYVFGWKLSNANVWDSAIRYNASNLEGDRFNLWAPSTVLKMPLGEKWNAHAEYFGIFSDGRENESTQHFFSPGVHYLFSSNLELGVRVGWGLNDQSPNFFSNVGVGVRF
jgi:hypothetical protein